MASFIAPMKAVSLARPAAGTTPLGPWDEWAIELKWDGMRLQVHVDRDSVRLFTGSGADATSRFPELADMADEVGAPAVLDGELVAFDEGRPSFAKLQQRIHVSRPSAALLARVPVYYLAFDLLHLDGNDVTSLPYRDRRRLLESLVDGGKAWSVPASTVGEADTLLHLAEQRELEGIVAKRLTSPYLAGRRSGDWVKIKIRRRQEFVVGGWSEGRNALSGTIGSLLVGVQGAAGLEFAGAVGSGLTDAERARLSDQLLPGDNPFVTDVAQITRTLTGRPHWVRPTLVVEVEYSLWSEGGSLWHPVYLGQRVDRDAADVVRETT